MELQKLIDAIPAAQLARHNLIETGTYAQVQAASGAIKAAQAALAKAITKDAKPCPTCGEHPHGMEQRWDIDKQEIIGFEIGCLVCPDHCAVGFFADDLEARLALCLKNWNAGPAKWWKDKRFYLELKDGAVVLRDKNQPTLWVSYTLDLPTEKDLAKFPEDERVTEYHRARRQAINVRNARVEAWRAQGNKRPEAPTTLA